MVPTFRSLLIYYDSYQLSYREAADKIEELARNLKTEKKTKKRILKIPCCYGARFGPDLADMEQLTGLDRKEMIDIHSSVDYKVDVYKRQAVFFQNGSWEYGNLTADGALTDDDLAMIPIYIGAGDEANQGLCTGTENYWCVNNQADEACLLYTSLVALMNKNKKFQKEQLSKEGYTEFKEFFCR